MTRNGKVNAVLIPGASGLSRYAPLTAKGLVRVQATTTTDLDQISPREVPPGVSPLDLLLEARAEDDR